MQKRKLQTIKVIAQTKKCVNIQFLHPISLRHCFAWMPLSVVENLPNGEILIPFWLWSSIQRGIKS